MLLLEQSLILNATERRKWTRWQWIQRKLQSFFRWRKLSDRLQDHEHPTQLFPQSQKHRILECRANPATERIVLLECIWKNYNFRTYFFHEIKVIQKCCQIVTSRKTRKRKALKKLSNYTVSKKVVKELNLRLDRIHSSILDANKYLWLGQGRNDQIVLQLEHLRTAKVFNVNGFHHLQGFIWSVPISI